jgi:PAS domain S-box-containing protein
MTTPTEPIGSIPRPSALTKAIGDNAQAIIRTVQHPLVVLDDKLRVTTANESFYRTFHVLPTEAEGRLIYDLGERQWDIPKLRSLLEEILLESSQFRDFEVEHQFENMGPKRMLLKAHRLDQRGDRQQLILLAIEDITERKQAEESLLENEERYRTLFNLSPMAVYTIDASGVILEFNRHAAELWARQPALGDTDLRFCGSFKMFRPDGSFMPHEECPMAEVVSGKLSEVNNGEVLIERPDGSHVTIIVNIRPLKNDRGEVTGAINCFYDITERKQAETLILFQKEAFEMAASGVSLVQVLEFLVHTAEGQSPQGALIAIHLLDETGTCFDQTVAPSLPASYAQATNGMEVSSATGPCCAAIARRKCVVVANVASSKEFPGFAAFALPLGIHAAWSTPMFSSTGKVIGTFASYSREPHEPTPQDNLLGEVLTRTASVIIERKQAEEELKNLMRKEQAARAEAEAANRVKDEFLAIVSHELRTPLNAIVGWTHLLRKGKLGQRESETAIQTIGRNATAQTAIISELLDVSRIISGKLKLDMQPVDLADVINEAVDVVRAAADAKGIEVVTSLDQKAGLVAGESVRLQQVIWNLLTNAIKFTPKDGSVKVQLERADSHVAVAVSDTGAGIPTEFLPHVFERFQQADSSEKRTHGGLGLGLSIVRNLVEMHGGSVSAESKGEVWVPRSL